MAHLSTTPPTTPSHSHLRHHPINPYTPQTPRRSSRYPCPNAPFLPNNISTQTPPQTSKRIRAYQGDLVKLVPSTREGAANNFSQPTLILPPTPADTPQQKRFRQHQHSSIPNRTASTSRRLFPTTSSKPLKTESFQIYTDFRERSPVLDPSPCNPFLTLSTESSQQSYQDSRNSKRKHVCENESNGELGRDEMIYVFRGKRVKRRLPASGPETGEDDEDAEGGWREAIKPTRLFRNEYEKMRTVTTGSVNEMEIWEGEEEDTEVENESEINI